MSLALYHTRIWSDGEVCVIKVGAIYRKTAWGAPSIKGLPNFSGMDYAPETDTYLIRETFEALREMTREEINITKEWLIRFEQEALADAREVVESQRDLSNLQSDLKGT